MYCTPPPKEIFIENIFVNVLFLLFLIFLFRAIYFCFFLVLDFHSVCFFAAHIFSLSRSSYFVFAKENQVRLPAEWLSWSFCKNFVFTEIIINFWDNLCSCDSFILSEFTVKMVEATINLIYLVICFVSIWRCELWLVSYDN